MNTESANMYGLLKAAAGADGPIPGPPGAPAAPATFHEPGPAAQDPVAHLGRRLGERDSAKAYNTAQRDRQEMAGKIADTQRAAATPEGKDYLQQLQSQPSSGVPSVWDNETSGGMRTVYLKGVTQPGDTQRRQPAKLPFEAPADYKFNAITSPRQDTRADWVQAPKAVSGPLNLSYHMNESMTRRAPDLYPSTERNSIPHMPENPAYPRKISGRGLGGVVGPLIDGFGKLMK